MSERRSTRGDGATAAAAVAGPRAGGWPWLEVVALIAFTATRWIGYRDHVDLHFSDEMIYLRQGAVLLAGAGWPEFAMAPVYSAWCGLVAAVTPDAVLAADALYGVTMLLLVLAVWWAFRPLLPAPWSLLAASWTATLPPIVQAGGVHALPNVHAAAAVLMVTAIGCWLRGRWVPSAMLGLACCGVRPEACSWLLLAGLGALAVVRPVPRTGVILLLAAGLLGAVAVSLAPSAAGRSWLAFKQHYARHAVLQRLLAAQAPDQPIAPEAALAGLAAMGTAFTNPDPVVAEDFPGAASPLAALRADPRRFAGFVAANLEPVPAGLVELLTPGLVPGPWRSWLVVASSLLAAVGWFAMWWWRPVQFIARVAAVPIGTTAVVVLTTVAWTGPRPELLLPCAWTWIVVFGGGVLSWLPTGGRWSRWFAAGAAIVVLVAAAAWPGPFRSPPWHPPQLRPGVRLLREHPLPDAARLLCSAADCYSVLGRLPLANCVQVDRLPDAAADFAGALRRAGVDAVLVDGLLAPTLTAIPGAMAHLASESWRLWQNAGDVRCYLRQ